LLQFILDLHTEFGNALDIIRGDNPLCNGPHDVIVRIGQLDTKYRVASSQFPRIWQITERPAALIQLLYACAYRDTVRKQNAPPPPPKGGPITKKAKRKTR